MKRFWETLRGVGAGILLTGAVVQASAAVEAAYEKSINDYRAARVDRLTAPNGWLTVVGRQELQPGRNSVGSAGDNQVVVPKAPPHLGVITVDALRRRVFIEPLPEARALVDGLAALKTEIRTDAVRPQSSVTVGTLTMTVIERGPKFILRVKDRESEGRRHFAGLEYFPIDASWRIEARWVPFETPKKIKVVNVIGQTTEEDAPGKAVFERDGKTWELTPTAEEDGSLFFVLRDATSGVETYAASRFLSAEAPKDGKVVLDFNKAENPPCAFTAYATCPLPIPDNILKLSITAGEKLYKGKH